MIAHLRGRLIAKHPNQAIVEAGGVGYDLTISIPTFTSLPELGSDVEVHVHTHVREDALALFGFLRVDEKKLFEKLISVSGIGPKLAITVLSGMSAEKMVTSIRQNDIGSLTGIPGIGKKTAERMVLELRDKLEGFGASADGPLASPLDEDVLSALMNLGYQRAPAERAVHSAAKHFSSTPSFEELFREALTLLGK